MVKSLILASWIAFITSPSGLTTRQIGPDATEYGCKDILGSLLYLHPKKCFAQPNDYNCRIIGNGSAYPAGWPFPPPVQLPSGTCYSSSDPIAPSGFSYVWYPPNGDVVIVGPMRGGSCERNRAAAAAAHPLEVGSGCFFQGYY